MKVGDIVSYPRHLLPVAHRGNADGEAFGVCILDESGVEFYENIGGHSFNGRGKQNRCWIIIPERAKIIEECP